MNKGNQKIIIALVLSITFLILLGGVYWYLNKQRGEVSSEPQVTPNEEEEAAHNEAKNSFDEKLKSRNDEIEKKNEEYAIKQKSVNKDEYILPKKYSLTAGDCTKIVDEELKSDCRTYLRVSEIVNSLDREACDGYSTEWRDYCVQQINFIKLDNWEDCKEIEDELMYDWCVKKYSIEKNDTTLCNYLNSGVGACVDRTKAINNGWGGDIKECADIVKTEYFLMCVNQTNDECSLLEDEYLEKRCESTRYYGMILNEGNKEDCAMLPLDTYSKTCEMYFDNNKEHIDFDGDGVNNGMEIFVDTNPLIAEEEAKEHAWYEDRWGEVFDNIYFITFEKLQSLLIDTDDDGLRDYEEVEIYKTDPKVQDTDGDKYNDGEEVNNSFDPLRA